MDELENYNFSHIKWCMWATKDENLRRKYQLVNVMKTKFALACRFDKKKKKELYDKIESEITITWNIEVDTSKIVIGITCIQL